MWTDPEYGVHSIWSEPRDRYIKATTGPLVRTNEAVLVADEGKSPFAIGELGGISMLDRHRSAARPVIAFVTAGAAWALAISLSAAQQPPAAPAAPAAQPAPIPFVPAST